MKTGKNINCLLCEKSFYVKPYQIGVTKFCSRKCAHIGKRKKFCVRGHEIAMTGRDRDGQCSVCRFEDDRAAYIPHPRKPTQFCPKGHDTFICGRATDGSCRICHNKRSIDWAKAHPKNRAAIMKTMRKNPAFKLGAYLRVRIRAALKDNVKNGSAVRDLGCTLDFLKKYIENKFYGRMSWKNWGIYWDLDHIKPLKDFDLTDRKQFLKACHYTNLQPLTIPDHDEKTAQERKNRSKLTKNNKEK